ncbi:MAG: hypothetical protein ACI8XX_001336, partial [Polaribacter sp.]
SLGQDDWIWSNPAISSEHRRIDANRVITIPLQVIKSID